MTLEITEVDFLRQVIQSGPHMMWFLGAGASRSSGLPTATDLSWDLKRRLYCIQQNQEIQSHDVSNKAIQSRIQGYMDSQGFPPLWDAREYSFYFEQFFADDYAAQQKYLKEVLSTGKVTSCVGHRAFAALLQMERIRLIFTTNFDEVVETAYSSMTGRNLSTFHLEGGYAAIDALNADQFPIYVKLHGDFRYQSVKNLSSDLLHNDQQLQKCFIAAATRFGAIVTGYSGRDGNIMRMFREAIDQNNAFPHGLFWSVPRASDVAPNVIELIEYAQTKRIKSGIVQAGTFDEMLSKIWRNTSGKFHGLDEKVRSAIAKPVRIPLPPHGRQYPILRTNALRITRLPEVCAAVDYDGDLNIGDVRSKLFETRPDCTLAYTDRILFWGDRREIEKVIDSNRIRAINTFTLDELVKLADESGLIKAFVEEAIGKALIVGKPLLLRKFHRTTWHAVIKHDDAMNRLFDSLRQKLGYKGAYGQLCGTLQGRQDVYWAESVSIRIEERNGSLWLLLRPDIWVSPLRERELAIDFLRNKKSKRYNTQSFEILSDWIGILLGSVGVGAHVAEITTHPDSEYSATFEISTRTAYSRRSSANV